MRITVRGFTFAAGAVLVLIGIPMLVCPGPGLLAISMGLALMFAGRVADRGFAPSGDSRAADQPIDVPFRVRSEAEVAATMSEQTTERGPDSGD